MKVTFHPFTRGKQANGIASCLTAIFIISHLLCFTTANAQNDTLKKYNRGGYLLKRSNGFEFYTDSTGVMNWERMENLELNNYTYYIIFRKQNEKWIYGLLNRSKGELLLNIEQDQIRPTVVYGVYALVKDKKVYAHYIAGQKKLIPSTDIQRHLNDDYLFFSDAACYVYDRDFTLKDSLKGVTQYLGHVYGSNSSFVAVKYNGYGALLDKNYKLRVEKNWGKTVENAGDLAVVRTDSGIGVYNLSKMKFITDCDYSSFRLYRLRFLLSKDDTAWNLFDSSGKKLKVFNARGIYVLDGLSAFLFADSTFTYGLMNGNGKLIQKPLWQHISQPIGGELRATVKGETIEKNYRLIYEKGSEKIVAGYEFAYNTNNAYDATGSYPGYPSNVPDDSGSRPPASNSPSGNDDNKVYEKVESDPSFTKDGLNETAYIKKAIADSKIKNKITDKGTVTLNFVAGKDGSVTNILVASSTNKKLEQPSILILQQMSGWKPAMQNGYKVNSKKTLVFHW